MDSQGRITQNTLPGGCDATEKEKTRRNLCAVSFQGGRILMIGFLLTPPE